LLIGVGSVSGGSSTNDTAAGSMTSQAVHNEQHIYPPVDDKRLLESVAFEERRSMQPIGTERMNKKPRTTGGLVTATHGTPSFPFMPPTNVMPPPWATSSLHKCLCPRFSFDTLVWCEYVYLVLWSAFSMSTWSKLNSRLLL